MSKNSSSSKASAEFPEQENVSLRLLLLLKEKIDEACKEARRIMDGKS